MRIEILSRFSRTVIWAHEIKGNNLKITVEAAVRVGINLTRAHLAKANLSGARLYGANLDSAFLAGADLSGADLAEASLAGAYLAGVNLSGANLVGANLSGAYLATANLSEANLARTTLDKADLFKADLSGANLTRAYLDGADLTRTILSGAYLGGCEKLIGQRPIFQVGPIGPWGTRFTAYLTDRGLRFDAVGLRQVSREIFEQYLSNELNDSVHREEYQALLALIDTHAGLWAPKEEQKGVFQRED